MFEFKNYTNLSTKRLIRAVFVVTLLHLVYPSFAWAQNISNTQSRPIDQIVGQVFVRVILKSDFDSDVRTYILQNRSYGQNIPFSEALWYSFLENSIENLVLLQKAKIDSVTIPDERVNRAMDQRIQQLLMKAGSEKALDRAFGKPVIQLR